MIVPSIRTPLGEVSFTASVNGWRLPLHPDGEQSVRQEESLSIWAGSDGVSFALRIVPLDLGLRGSPQLDSLLTNSLLTNSLLSNSLLSNSLLTDCLPTSLAPASAGTIGSGSRRHATGVGGEDNTVVGGHRDDIVVWGVSATFSCSRASGALRFGMAMTSTVQPRAFAAGTFSGWQYSDSGCVVVVLGADHSISSAAEGDVIERLGMVGWSRSPLAIGLLRGRAETLTVESIRSAARLGQTPTA